MKGEKREHWLRLCVEAADERDASRLLDLVSEINRLLGEKGNAAQKRAAGGTRIHHRSCWRTSKLDYARWCPWMVCYEITLATRDASVLWWRTLLLADS
jgi:hypothetical protein